MSASTVGRNTTDTPRSSPIPPCWSLFPPLSEFIYALLYALLGAGSQSGNVRRAPWLVDDRRPTRFAEMPCGLHARAAEWTVAPSVIDDHREVTSAGGDVP